MRRFSLWLREHPAVADAVLALAMITLNMSAAPRGGPFVVSAALGAMFGVPLFFRRRFPCTMAALTLVLSVAATVVAYVLGWLGPGRLPLALGIFLYTLVVYTGRREALLYLAGLVVDTGLAFGLLNTGLGEVVLLALYFALCWMVAEFLGARRAYDAEVKARLAVADYDRERSAHEAVAAERTRIARELHDVVAHAVSVMVVQADGASYALGRDSEIVASALTNIASTGRQALGELRRTVELLRTDHAPEQLPQPGTAGIAKLVELMRATGLTVELEQSGSLDDLPHRVSLGVHRIIQESLTNTLRHAGTEPTAWVRVQRRTDDVLVEVTDTGGIPTVTGRLPGTGNGLTGMRERVAVLQGSLEAGRLADGRWRVRALLPIPPE